MAYRPLPHGVIKVELQSGDDGHDTQSSSDVQVENKDQDGTITDQENIEHREYGVVKEEPTSDGDDDGDDGCELVAYPSLPHGVIKEEQEVVDGCDEFISGVQQIGQQEGNKNRMNEATEDAPIIGPFAEIPVSGNENAAGEPGTNKRKRTGKGNLSSDHEKGSLRKPSVKAIRSQVKDKLPFECKKCGRAFKAEIYLKKHARSCGVDPQFVCKECGNQFKRKDQLRQHLMKIHNVEQSQLATFGAGPNMRPDFPFKCDKCNSSYKLKGNLARHLKYECQLDPSFPCNLCDYRATRKDNLRDHLVNVHSVGRSQLSGFGAAAPETRPVQPFKCEKCDKTYKRKKTLAQHLKFECGLDPSFSCTQCNYRASRKGNLKQHLIHVHAGAGLSKS